MYLEKLHTDTSEHELEESGDDEDVANSADGHEHTLNHALKTQTAILIEGYKST